MIFKKRLPKRKYQRLILPATPPPELPAPPLKKTFRVSRRNFKALLTKAREGAKPRKAELKYPTLHPSVLQALRNSNVRYGNLNVEWIDQYKIQSVEYREEFLKAALEAMAQIEATRKTSDNLIHDYGMPYGLDLGEIANVTMKVLSMRSMELFTKGLPASVREKMMELYAEQLFTVTGRAPAPYKLAPSNSPFKSGHPAVLNAMDGFSTPVAGQSMNALPSPAIGNKNPMPPRGLTL